MQRGKLIILSGPSGVGKGTIRQILFDKQRIELAYSISMTTRKPRPGEKEGVDYYFVEKETFENMIENDEFLEYASFVDNYYGTPRKEVERLLDQGKNVLLEIEVQGALQVIKKMPEALSIFILPPSMAELEKRIRGRQTELEEVINKRLEKAKTELSYQEYYKYKVVNDSLEQAVLKIEEIIMGV